MTAFSILRHAIAMIFRDRHNSLRLFVPLWIVTAGMPFFLIYVIGAAMWDESNTQPSVFEFLSVFLAMLSQGVLMAGIAIAWHRFVLLDEVPGPVWPRVSLMTLGSYVLRSVGLFLLLALLLSLISIPMFMLGGSEFAAVAVFVMIGVPAGLALVVLNFRWSLILPAAAIGQPISMKQARRATEGKSKLILFLTLLYVIFSVVIGAAVGVVRGVLSALDSLPLPLELALNGAMNAFLFLVGASMLTTLYGVFIEGRELS